MPSNWSVKAAQSTKTNMGTDGEKAAQLEAGTLITLSHSERILCKAAEAGDHYSSHIQITSLSEGWHIDMHGHKQHTVTSNSADCSSQHADQH